MKRCTLSLIGLLVLVVAFPGSAPAQKHKKKKAEQANPATAQDYQLQQQTGSAVGKLTDFDPTTRDLTLQVDTSTVEPKAGSARQETAQAQRLLRQEEEIQQARLRVAEARTERELAAAVRHLNNVIERAETAHPGARADFKTVTQHKDYKLTGTEEVKVRRAEPPTRYDDKGEVKPYTAAELKEMKGTNSKLPGYTAKLDDLEVGQTVKVFVTAPKKKDKSKEPDATEDAADNTPPVTMIEILKDAPPPPEKGKSK